MLLTTESTSYCLKTLCMEKEKDTVLKSANKKFNSKTSDMTFIDSKYLNKFNDY